MLYQYNSVVLILVEVWWTPALNHGATWTSVSIHLTSVKVFYSKVQLHCGTRFHTKNLCTRFIKGKSKKPPKKPEDTPTPQVGRISSLWNKAECQKVKLSGCLLYFGASSSNQPGPVHSPQQPQGGDGGGFQSERSILGNQVDQALL